MAPVQEPDFENDTVRYAQNTIHGIIATQVLLLYPPTAIATRDILCSELEPDRDTQGACGTRGARSARGSAGE